MEVVGPCSISPDGACVRSPNFGGSYPDSTTCVISNVPRLPLFATLFDTKPFYDFVYVNGEGVSGTDWPDGVIAKDGILTWSSDEAYTARGWQICWSEQLPESHRPPPSSPAEPVEAPVSQVVWIAASSAVVALACFCSLAYRSRLWQRRHAGRSRPWLDCTRRPPHRPDPFAPTRAERLHASGAKMRRKLGLAWRRGAARGGDLPVWIHGEKTELPLAEAYPETPAAPSSSANKPHPSARLAWASRVSIIWRASRPAAPAIRQTTTFGQRPPCEGPLSRGAPPPAEDAGSQFDPSSRYLAPQRATSGGLTALAWLVRSGAQQAAAAAGPCGAGVGGVPGEGVARHSSRESARRWLSAEVDACTAPVRSSTGSPALWGGEEASTQSERRRARRSLAQGGSPTQQAGSPSQRHYLFGRKSSVPVITRPDVDPPVYPVRDEFV